MLRYETPSFVEVKMDAEIGSYQEDSDRSHFFMGAFVGDRDNDGASESSDRRD